MWEEAGLAESDGGSDCSYGEITSLYTFKTLVLARAIWPCVTDEEAEVQARETSALAPSPHNSVVEH